MEITLPSIAKLFSIEQRNLWAEVYLHKNHHEFRFVRVEGCVIIAERKEDYQHRYKGNR